MHEGHSEDLASEAGSSRLSARDRDVPVCRPAGGVGGAPRVRGAIRGWPCGAWAHPSRTGGVEQTAGRPQRSIEPPSPTGGDRGSPAAAYVGGLVGSFVLYRRHRRRRPRRPPQGAAAVE